MLVHSSAACITLKRVLQASSHFRNSGRSRLSSRLLRLESPGHHLPPGQQQWLVGSGGLYVVVVLLQLLVFFVSHQRACLCEGQAQPLPDPAAACRRGCAGFSLVFPAQSRALDRAGPGLMAQVSPPPVSLLGLMATHHRLGQGLTRLQPRSQDPQPHWHYIQRAPADELA